MRKPKYIRVQKLDAARRQIDTAAKLWFDDGDPVSIHTLLYAALEIVDGLYKRSTGKRLLFGNAAMQSRQDLAKTAKDWPNFFKHGREYELDRVLEFNPDANLILFSACIAGLAHLDPTPNAMQNAVATWLFFNVPGFFPVDMHKKRPPPEVLREIKRLSKKQFLEHHLRINREGR